MKLHHCIAFASAVCLVFSGLPAAAVTGSGIVCAESESVAGGLIYEKNADSVTIVCSDANLPSELVIPAEIEGLPVKSIADDAFACCAGLVSVVIPEGVESVGNNAFCRCPHLKSVTFPDSVTSLGFAVLNSCSKLKTVILPKNCTEIPIEMMSQCTELESITIPEGVTKISAGAFSGCEKLSEISIPDSVTEFEPWAFILRPGFPRIAIRITVFSS